MAYLDYLPQDQDPCVRLLWYHQRLHWAKICFSAPSDCGSIYFFATAGPQLQFIAGDHPQFLQFLAMWVSPTWPPTLWRLTFKHSEAEPSTSASKMQSYTYHNVIWEQHTIIFALSFWCCLNWRDRIIQRHKHQGVGIMLFTLGSVC